jgi:hypothetical protein
VRTGPRSLPNWACWLLRNEPPSGQTDAMAPVPNLPSVSVGQLDLVAKCPRRLANQLDPELRSAGGQDPSMRLWGTIVEAIQIAHRDAFENDIPPLFTMQPPAGLSVEEQSLFTRTLEQYDDAFGDEPGTLHERAGEIIRRPSAAGGFQLSARIDLVFRVPQQPLEIRRIRLKEAPPFDPPVRRADIGLAALLRSANESSTTMAVVRTLWAHTTASVTQAEVTGDQVRAIRDEVNAMVDQARATPDHAVSGWWCNSCRFAHRCPAIAQTPIEQLRNQIQGAPTQSDDHGDNDHVAHFVPGGVFQVLPGDTDFVDVSPSTMIRRSGAIAPDANDPYGDDW